MNSYRFDLDAIITIEIGVLTIFTLFFSFASIKSQLQDQFEKQTSFLVGQIRKQFGKKKKSTADLITSKINRFSTELLNEIDLKLDVMGKTFRIGIYSGFFLIALILLNEP